MEVAREGGGDIADAGLEQADDLCDELGFAGQFGQAFDLIFAEGLAFCTEGTFET